LYISHLKIKHYGFRKILKIRVKYARQLSMNQQVYRDKNALKEMIELEVPFYIEYSKNMDGF